MKPILSHLLDHVHEVQKKDAEFLFTHPWPNSLALTLMLKGKRMQATPLAKEGKKLSTASKHFFFPSRTLGLKMLNYIACMAHDNYAVWDSISNTTADLLEEKLQKTQKQACSHGGHLEEPLPQQSGHSLTESSMSPFPPNLHRFTIRFGFGQAVYSDTFRHPQTEAEISYFVPNDPSGTMFW